jgi:hypothetical protein
MVNMHLRGFFSVRPTSQSKPSLFPIFGITILHTLQDSTFFGGHSPLEVRVSLAKSVDVSRGARSNDRSSRNSGSVRNL